MKMTGIYCYKDTMKNNEIVYIGKDSNIHKNRRHIGHKSPCHYNDQPFNRILQNNPNRYEYHIICSWEREKYPQEVANIMERLYIKLYDPLSNFTEGGDGTTGYHLSEETKKKISKANKGKKRTLEERRLMSERAKGEKNGMYGKTHSDKVKKAVSERCKGVPLSEEHKMNISKANNTSGYYRVSIEKSKTSKQGFLYRYTYSENGKHKNIRSNNLEKLEEKVKARGLKWKKMD